MPGKSFGIPEGITVVGQFAADIPVGNAEKIPIGMFSEQDMKVVSPCGELQFIRWLLSFEFHGAGPSGGSFANGLKTFIFNHWRSPPSISCSMT